uniref:Uncharacterized protein n=1 Tax=Siphoviridae sp. cty3u30 TaxID=2825744 RepID=A0A8S5Q6T5_9CAUD|nr:MAG TPA: Protein of unknown function (DUF1056) [Siphoviridae sp. cty3u30]DAL07477.1 MAG TPA: Protein of unknown function (DUF1056) [Caudoviricetes sp.]
MRRILQTVSLYIDDLLLLGGGACFIRAAYLWLGDAAAYAAAGMCLTAYAVVIARSRRR